MKRSSHKELSGKPRDAQDAVSQGRVRIIDPTAIAADALELGYSLKDLADILTEILGEVGSGYYAGARPPQRSYEDQTKGSELFAFRWESKRFGCKIYLKFALKDEILWLISLHPHREERGRE